MIITLSTHELIKERGKHLQKEKLKENILRGPVLSSFPPKRPVWSRCCLLIGYSVSNKSIPSPNDVITWSEASAGAAHTKAERVPLSEESAAGIPPLCFHLGRQTP